MSYARFGDDSNVYFYQGDGLICSACRFAEAWHSVSFNTARAAIDHLEKHIDAGDKVPDYTIKEIKEDFPDLDLPLENE